MWALEIVKLINSNSCSCPDFEDLVLCTVWFSPKDSRSLEESSPRAVVLCSSFHSNTLLCKFWPPWPPWPPIPDPQLSENSTICFDSLSLCYGPESTSRWKSGAGGTSRWWNLRRSLHLFSFSQNLALTLVQCLKPIVSYTWSSSQVVYGRWASSVLVTFRG